VIDDSVRADAPGAGKSTLIKILSDGKLDATFVYPTGGGATPLAVIPRRLVSAIPNRGHS
jgi:hypothetical protein